MNLPSLYRRLGILLEQRSKIEIASEEDSLTENEALNRSANALKSLQQEIMEVENQIDSIEKST